MFDKAGRDSRCIFPGCLHAVNANQSSLLLFHYLRLNAVLFGRIVKYLHYMSHVGRTQNTHVISG